MTRFCSIAYEGSEITHTCSLDNAEVLSALSAWRSMMSGAFGSPRRGPQLSEPQLRQHFKRAAEFQSVSVLVDHA
jgi:hypothetical protein